VFVSGCVDSGGEIDGWDIKACGSSIVGVVFVDISALLHFV
jgi:hypothetical protein